MAENLEDINSSNEGGKWDKYVAKEDNTQSKWDKYVVTPTDEKKNSLSSQYVSSPTQYPLASPNFSQGEKMAKVGFTIPSAANIQHTPEQQNWLLNTISS
jgi:hypothetical protein